MELAKKDMVVAVVSGDHPLPSLTLMGGAEKSQRLPRGLLSVACPAAPPRAAAEGEFLVACLGGLALKEKVNAEKHMQGEPTQRGGEEHTLLFFSLSPGCLASPVPEEPTFLRTFRSHGALEKLPSAALPCG